MSRSQASVLRLHGHDLSDPNLSQVVAVQSLMLEPVDATWREQYAAAIHAAHYRACKVDIPSDSWVMHALALGRGTDKLTTEAALRHTKGAVVGSAVLQHLVLDAVRELHGAKETTSFLATGRDQAERIGKSGAWFQNKAWPIHKQVAHFWAAAKVAFFLRENLNFFVFDPKYLKRYLALSAEVLERAGQCKLHQQSTYLVDPNRAIGISPALLDESDRRESREAFGRYIDEVYGGIGRARNVKQNRSPPGG